MAATKEIPKEVLEAHRLIDGKLFRGEVEITGSDIGRGYRQFKFKGRRYLMHRVLFALHNGFQPELIDHIDGNTTNNSLENLRPASLSENMINRKLQINSNSGITGVDYMKRGGVWRAQIHKSGVKIYLGTFKTLEAAASERKKAETIYHGDFSPRHADALLAELERQA
jgi:hypothetical protein